MDSRRSSSGGPTREASPEPRRTSRHRGLVGTIVGVALLAVLCWLTYANATGSKSLDEAVAAESRGDFPTALRASMEHLERRPWSPEAHRVAARCLSRLDFAEQAEAYYRRAWGLTASDLLYRAYGLTRQNLRERALEAFDEVLRLDPLDVAALRLKAGVLISMLRWHEVGEIGRLLAGSALGSVRAEAPVAAAGGHWTLRPREVDSVAALGSTLIGIAYHNQGDFEAAVEAYQKVLELDPELRSMPLDRRLFWSQFGEDLLSIGRSADVLRYLSLVEGSLDDPGLVALMARAHMLQGSVDGAEKSWLRVRELSPDHPAAWLNLGRIELGRGNLEEATRLLTRAATLAPGSYAAAYNLGITYQRLGRTDEARKWEQKASLLRAPKPSPSPAP
ncbi:tetratricopeptide repeat protein [Tundrisphaera lichenicola]|uniref:tetratricopeptide repeat protein n=1 Tax=Tundrisphaera lichenicola TaxID=2029860 RepID=UPI003EBD7326